MVQSMEIEGDKMIPWILLALSVLSLVSVFIYVELEQPKREYSISEEQMGEKVEICGKLKATKLAQNMCFSPWTLGSQM